jgi:hypothetical protein
MRQPYEQPELTSLGSITELTEAQVWAPGVDGVWDLGPLNGELS